MNKDGIYALLTIGIAAWLGIPALSVGQVVEVYSEKGVVVHRYTGGTDSLLRRIDRLENSRYLVSVSNSAHQDSALHGMSLSCMFSDPFCQGDSPLMPDSVYDSSDLYDAYWISIDHRDNETRLFWEKSIADGYFDGLFVVYGSDGTPTYISNFRKGQLDGLKAEYDSDSGLYSCNYYDHGRSIRSISWSIEGKLLFDTLWKAERSRF